MRAAPERTSRFLQMSKSYAPASQAERQVTLEELDRGDWDRLNENSRLEGFCPVLEAEFVLVFSR